MQKTLLTISQKYFSVFIKGRKKQEKWEEREREREENENENENKIKNKK